VAGKKVAQLVVRNWPLKLAAVFFAIMLYVAVAAQQPLTQTFAMRLEIAVPPGRTVKEQPAGVQVVITGRGTEMMKLRSLPRTIRKAIPDTFSASVWRTTLQNSDVDIPKGTDVQVADVRPREIEVVLDSVARKEVRVVPLVRVEAESGYVVRGLSLTPSVAHLVGPGPLLARIDSVLTVPTVISSVNGPFLRTIPVDTAPLGVVRIAPKEVRVAGEVVAIIERSIDDVPIASSASGVAAFVLAPERVSVSVRGPEARVNMLTKDSLRVVAHLVGKAGAGGYARLTVTAPPGIVARARPDSVALKRRGSRG
jgi:YbbR domain-containing protein